MEGKPTSKVARLRVEPVARPEAIVLGPQVRFTVLTPRLIRLEYSPDEAFEDHASQAFWYRRQPAPEFQVHRSGDQIEIATEELRLRYRAGPKGFQSSTLSIEVKSIGATWRYGDRNSGNLLGTARTLDHADGPVRLQPGLVSRSGWSVVDDSASLVFDEDGWLEPRRAPHNLDLYFFGFGHDYLGSLDDLCRVAGDVPLIPRWALGNWWSRYWEYSQDELAGLLADFRSHGIPLAVCIVDMDWHITQTGNASRGWTGYTWNPALFPDPEGFLRGVKEQGLKVGLNLHPADGVHPHEAAYPEMAQRLGVDPSGEDPVVFDIANPRFVNAYFEVLHHPMEQQGVNFWWLDWQQGERSNLQGLDPLWWLNHLHFYDSGRDPEQRPFIFSRWGGLGNHRYPIGFSGDTVVSWESLAFQPYFTATAANVGYGWWSHDVGGHMGGVEEAELYLRWVQWGVFSPIFRLHSTKNPFHERRPWGYDAEVLRLARQAMQLRHSLIPYLYSMAWKNFSQRRPLILPMYYLSPEEEAAYHCPGQYAFGSELVAAPHVTRREPETRLSRQSLWLPEGDWFDFFTGEHFSGGWHARYGGLEDIPLLAKAGAIVPLGPPVEWGGVANPEEISVYIFPGADGHFELYEDDGETQAYLNGVYAITPFALTWREQELGFHIEPVKGDAGLLPPRRVFNLLVCGVKRPEEIRLSLNGSDIPSIPDYDDKTETLSLSRIAVAPQDEVTLTLRVKAGSLLSPRDRRPETCREMLHSFRIDSWIKQEIDQALPELLDGRTSLMQFSHTLTGAQFQALSSAIHMDQP